MLLLESYFYEGGCKSLWILLLDPHSNLSKSTLAFVGMIFDGIVMSETFNKCAC